MASKRKEDKVMSEHKELDTIALLDEIGRVDAPPFLLTRIQQKIIEARTERVSPVLAWTAGLATVLLLLINAWVLTSVPTSHESAADMTVNSMFFPKNSLYE
jgi:hypothetical protein